jgi:hypothetical protein
LGHGTVIAVEPSPTATEDDIECAINRSKFTLRLDDRGTVTLSGMFVDELDHKQLSGAGELSVDELKRP